MLRWRRAILIPVLAHALVAIGCADSTAPVTWAAKLEGARTVAPGSEVRVRLDAEVDRGWYFYSVTQPAGGPIPARVWLSDTTVFRPAGSVSGPAPVRSFDRTFKMDVEKYPESSTFVLLVLVPPDAAPGAAEIRVNAMYQACNDSICLSPKTVTMSVPVTIGRN